MKFPIDGNDLAAPAVLTNGKRPAEWIRGSFSIDDGNGNGSENVSFEMNSRFFNLRRVYSNLLKMTSVGEFPWS